MSVLQAQVVRAVAQFGETVRRKPNVARVVLYKRDAGERAQVAEWSPPPEPAVLTGEVHAAAEEYARAEGLNIPFVVVAYDDSGKEVATREWTVDPRGGHHFGQGGQAMAVDAMALAVLERHARANQSHADNAFRRLAEATEKIHGHYQSIIASQQKEIDTLRTELRELRTLREELETKKHERQLELQRASTTDDMRRELFAKLNTYVTAWLTKSGKGGAFQGAELVDAFLERFAGNKERLEAILAGQPIQFQPDELVALVGIIDARMAAHGKANGAAAAPPAKDTAKEATAS